MTLRSGDTRTVWVACRNAPLCLTDGTSVEERAKLCPSSTLISRVHLGNRQAKETSWQVCTGHFYSVRQSKFYLSLDTEYLQKMIFGLVILDIYHESDQTILFPRTECTLPKCASGLSFQLDLGPNPFVVLWVWISYHEKVALEWSQRTGVKYAFRFLNTVNSQSKRLIDQRKKERKKEWKKEHLPHFIRAISNFSAA